MNNNQHLLLISLIVTIFSCMPSNKTMTHVGSVESDTELIVGAEYPESQTSNVEAFLDSAFKQKVSLGEDSDIHVKLNGIHKINIKSSDGHLELIYSKKDSTANGYSSVIEIGDKLSKKLIP